MPRPIRRGRMHEYTFYFSDGTREVLRGETRSAAFISQHGYQDVSKLDFYVNGRDNNYTYKNKKWIRNDLLK